MRNSCITIATYNAETAERAEQIFLRVQRALR
jgi:hypothetical protein